MAFAPLATTDAAFLTEGDLFLCFAVRWVGLTTFRFFTGNVDALTLFSLFTPPIFFPEFTVGVKCRIFTREGSRECATGERSVDHVTRQPAIRGS